MRIGIISDTHGYCHPALRDVFAGVDRILHAGDIGRQSVLDFLGGIAPVTAVRGNIDGEEFFGIPKSVDIELGGFRFAMVHNAGDPLRPLRGVIGGVVRDGDVILVSGHYHSYWCTGLDTGRGHALWLSPGAAGNEGAHAERTALILTLCGPAGRSGDFSRDLGLEKVRLGPRGMGVG